MPVVRKVSTKAGMLEVLGFAGYYHPPNSQFDPAAAVLGGVPISALWCKIRARRLDFNQYTSGERG